MSVLLGGYIKLIWKSLLNFVGFPMLSQTKSLQVPPPRPAALPVDLRRHHPSGNVFFFPLEKPLEKPLGFSVTWHETQGWFVKVVKVVWFVKVVFITQGTAELWKDQGRSTQWIANLSHAPRPSCDCFESFWERRKSRQQTTLPPHNGVLVTYSATPNRLMFKFQTC